MSIDIDKIQLLLIAHRGNTGVTDRFEFNRAVLGNAEGKPEHETNRHTKFFQDVASHDLLQTLCTHIRQILFTCEPAVSNVSQKLDWIRIIETRRRRAKVILHCFCKIVPVDVTMFLKLFCKLLLEYPGICLNSFIRIMDLPGGEIPHIVIDALVLNVHFLEFLPLFDIIFA